MKNKCRHRKHVNVLGDFRHILPFWASPEEKLQDILEKREADDGSNN
jgi:hypothetical protein